MSATKKVTIVGVGAFVKPSGEKRYRMFGRGDTVSVPDEVADQLVADGVAEVTGGTPGKKTPKPSGDGGLGDSPTDEQIGAAKVDDLIAWVGEDEDRAARVLAVEEAKGTDARSTLVEKLEAVVG